MTAEKDERLSEAMIGKQADLSRSQEEEIADAFYRQRSALLTSQPHGAAMDTVSVNVSAAVLCQTEAEDILWRRAKAARDIAKAEEMPAVEKSQDPADASLQKRIDDLTWRLHQARAFSSELLAEKHDGRWHQAEAEMLAAENAWDAETRNSVSADNAKSTLAEAESLLRRCAAWLDILAENNLTNSHIDDLLAELRQHLGRPT